jgi:hypothetical protein
MKMTREGKQGSIAKREVRKDKNSEGRKFRRVKLERAKVQEK